MKRLLDFSAALVGLVVLLPALLVLGLLVRLTSRGPALYRGRRVGRFGTPFYLLKFRTMVVDAEKLGGPSTAGDDPRVTRVGWFLRRFKLDELPQLINVLVGDMSLVGPRPEVPSEVAEYTADQRRVLALRPGITDLASLWNADEGDVLAGAVDPHRAYKSYIQPTKLALQLKYLEQRSFCLDLKLIVFTIMKVVRKGWVPRILSAYPPPVVPEDERRTSASPAAGS